LHTLSAVVTQGTGVLLVLTAAYLFTIRVLSPHALPGLDAATGLVLFTGCAVSLGATRFTRAAAAARAGAFAFGLIGFVTIALAARAPRGHVVAEARSPGAHAGPPGNHH